MGRGDKRSRKGKITIGSYGKSRPHKVTKSAVVVAPVKAVVAPAAPKAEKKKKA